MTWQSVKVDVKKLATQVLFGLALLCAVQAQDKEPALSRDHPLLDLDLSKFGYDTSSATRRLRKFIDFTDATHLAVAWLTLDDPALAEKTGPLTARPGHLRMLVLDATSGRKLGAQSWSTPSTPVRFLGARDGRFLTCTGNVLRLFSPGFEVIREKVLPNDSACLSLNPFSGNSQWGISPSKQSLLLSSPAGQQGHENALLDVETFAVIDSWIGKLPIDSISDHWLFASCGPKQEACIRSIDKPWQRFQPSGMEATNGFKLKATRFVSDDTLVMGWNTMTVAKVDATRLFEVKLSKGRSLGATVASTGGERFAVIENRQRGLTSAPLDMYAFPSNDSVVVYSISDRRAIYSVKVKGTSPWTPWDVRSNQLALSPDGSLLAVLDRGNLKVYRLPETTPLVHKANDGR